MLGSAIVAGSALAAPRGLTVEDLVAMERVGSPVLSPDASRVVYTVRTTELDKNRGHTELWMVDLRAAKPAPQRLTNHDRQQQRPAMVAGRRRHLLPVGPLRLVAGLAPAAGRRRSGAGHRPAARRRQLPPVADRRPHRDEPGRVPRLRRPGLHQGAPGPAPARTRPAAASTTACSCATGIPGPTAATRCCTRRRSTASGRVSAAPVSLSGIARRRRAVQAVRRP